jgi:hypothetical protein
VFTVRYKRKWGPSLMYVRIEVKPMSGYQGIAGSNAIALSDQVVHSAYMYPLIRHEYGHLWDNNDFITQEDRQWFMTAMGGSPTSNWRGGDAL